MQAFTQNLYSYSSAGKSLRTSVDAIHEAAKRVRKASRNSNIAIMVQLEPSYTPIGIALNLKYAFFD